MPVFKRNLHLGRKDPLWETDDISDGAITWAKLSPELQSYLKGALGEPAEVVSAPTITLTDITHDKHSELTAGTKAVWKAKFECETEGVTIYCHIINNSTKQQVGDTLTLESGDELEFVTSGTYYLEATAMVNERESEKTTSSTFEVVPVIYKTVYTKLRITSFSYGTNVTCSGVGAAPTVNTALDYEEYHTDGEVANGSIKPTEKTIPNPTGVTYTFSKKDAAASFSINSSTGAITASPSTTTSGTTHYVRVVASVVVNGSTFTSDAKDGSNSQDGAYIMLSANNKTDVSANGGTLSDVFAVSTGGNVTGITLTCDGTVVTSATLKAGNKVEIVVSKNSSTSSRSTGWVKVTSSINTTPLQFSVTQKGATYYVYYSFHDYAISDNDAKTAFNAVTEDALKAYITSTTPKLSNMGENQSESVVLNGHTDIVVFEPTEYMKVHKWVDPYGQDYIDSLGDWDAESYTAKRTVTIDGVGYNVYLLHNSSMSCSYNVITKYK